MHTLLALLLFVVVFVVPNQVIAEDGPKDIVNKRQVSVLARDGHLPYEGKRYLGEKKPDAKESESTWSSDSSGNPSVVLLRKRYVGALAKTGDLRFKQRDDKRDDVDTLIDELLTAEELKRIRLEALREELLKQREEEEAEEDAETEKRSLSSLARSGAFPLRSEKRSIASMARGGYLRSPYSVLSNEEYDKRGIASMARNGQLPAFGKRGGISSIMRNGYPYQKRDYYDAELNDDLMDEYDIDDKRNVASLARGYSLPSMGKRNIASFARNGWIQDFGQNSKKSYLEDLDNEVDEYKRNIPSLLRNRVAPLVEGKRYLGAFIASNGVPFSKHTYDDSKRNIGSMARSWNFPDSSFRYGKRDWYEDEMDNDNIAKRYVSSLLKQGPLPVASEHSEMNSDANQNYDDQQSEDENMDEQKRHIGSLLAQKSFAMRKKKSISPEDQFGEQPTTAKIPTKSLSDENKMENDIHQNHRQKRDIDFAISDEYTMPVMQNNDVSEYDEGISRTVSDEQSTRKKRYFAVRGGGKIPGGRLPHVGRSRSNNPNSGRRRH